jgi:carbon-monoxide dehydrogenase medium subunit
MKPAPFEYSCPDSIAEALELLARHGEEAKLMAGGQSLVPMLNFRVVRPGRIIDIGRLLELDYVRERPDGGLVIGALTRHRVLETSTLVAQRFPVIPEAMRHVAHLAIRNRGTIGGSLSHADPAAELPMLVVLLDATLVLRSLRGERAVPAREFFTGPLSTVLRADELVERIEIPGLAAHGCAFEELSRRAGDFALAATGVVLQLEGTRIRSARVAMMGVGDTPLRCPQAEAVLEGGELTDETLVAAVRAACGPLQPRQDLQASPDYRRHVAGVLLQRALRRAWSHATGPRRAVA